MQNATPSPRPKIALALAGGSALGLSHIGVITWLEEHRIPVDYVAGTSIGAVVGGAYATGLNPAEMRTLLTGINWEDALRGETPFQTLTFRRKEDRRNIANRLEFGLRGGLGLPSGLDPAQPIGLILSHISLPYSDIESFDALPIPFRCIATDLEKGESVVLKNGSLVTALRASMSIPGIFTPTERDGKLLADGAILNNIPTEAAKGMGADVIIAVDLYTPLADRKSLKSFLGVLSQTIAIMVQNNNRRNLQLADIVIRPDLNDINGSDFAKGSVLIERGYKSVENLDAAQKARLLSYALSEKEWHAYLATRYARKRVDTVPQFVQVTGVSGQTASGLSDRLRRFVGKPLDTNRLDKEITDVAGTGRYENVLYEQTRNGQQDGLLVRVQEKPYGPPFLNLGLEVNGSDVNNPGFNLASRVTTLDVGGYNAELRSDFRIGTMSQISTEYYRPFSRSRWFIAPHLGYFEDRQSLFQNSHRVAIYGTRTSEVAFDLGYKTSRSSELRLGYSVGHFAGSIRTGDPALPTTSGSVRSARFRYAYDGQDSQVIPTKGTRLTSTSNWYFHSPGTAKAFPTTNFELNHFSPTAKNNLLFQTVDVGTSFGSQVPAQLQFRLGGPLRLGAFGLDEYRNNTYALLSTGILHRVTQLPSQLGGKVLVGTWYEAGSASSTFQATHFLSDISAGFIAETLLGPVIIGGSYGEGGRHTVYFSLGRVF